MANRFSVNAKHADSPVLNNRSRHITDCAFAVLNPPGFAEIRGQSIGRAPTYRLASRSNAWFHGL
jgi:hypothetical protein